LNSTRLGRISSRPSGGLEGVDMFSHPLARDVFVVVACKIVLIIAAAILIFGPSARPKVGAEQAAARLLGAPPEPSQGPHSP
jgi:hypothetical protein